jgi:hypothetical protein
LKETRSKPEEQPVPSQKSNQAGKLASHPVAMPSPSRKHQPPQSPSHIPCRKPVPSQKCQPNGQASKSTPPRCPGGWHFRLGLGIVGGWTCYFVNLVGSSGSERSSFTEWVEGCKMVGGSGLGCTLPQDDLLDCLFGWLCWPVTISIRDGV